MERHAPQPRQPTPTADETDAVRLARIRRDLALTPSQRLDKFAELCRQADLLRSARVTLLAASPQQLIAMKQARGSAQDQADIETLRLLDAQDRH